MRDLRRRGKNQPCVLCGEFCEDACSAMLASIRRSASRAAAVIDEPAHQILVRPRLLRMPLLRVHCSLRASFVLVVIGPVPLGTVAHHLGAQRAERPGQVPHSRLPLTWWMPATRARFCMRWLTWRGVNPITRSAPAGAVLLRSSSPARGRSGADTPDTRRGSHRRAAGRRSSCASRSVAPTTSSGRTSTGRCWFRWPRRLLAPLPCCGCWAVILPGRLATRRRARYARLRDTIMASSVNFESARGLRCRVSERGARHEGAQRP